MFFNVFLKLTWPVVTIFHYGGLCILAKTNFVTDLENFTGYLFLIASNCYYSFSLKRMKVQLSNIQLSFEIDIRLNQLKILLLCLLSFFVTTLSQASAATLNEADLIKACVANQYLFDQITVNKTNTDFNVKFSPQVSIVDERQIQDIFRILSNKSNIPYKRNKQGCEARALAMAIIMDNMCLKSVKAFVQGPIYLQNPKLTWSLHVAPILYVVTKDQKLMPYIIDPSLYERAVTLHEWASKLGTASFSTSKPLYITNQYNYLMKDIYLELNEYRQADLDKMEDDLETLDSTAYGVLDSFDSLISIFSK